MNAAGARGAFVTGTDTGIGKTVVASCLVRAWNADYWKPVQTGLAEEEGDTQTVAHLAGAAPGRLHAPRHALQAPLSPEAAAALEGVRIALADFALPDTRNTLVIEGAGGVMVPLGGGAFMADLIASLALPAVLVARSTLGTINHTLLSLDALRARGIAVAGVVMVGPPNAGNRKAIEAHGRCAVIAELGVLEPVCAETVAAASRLFSASEAWRNAA